MWIVNDIVSPLIANIKSSWGDRVTDEGHNDLYDSCLWYYSQKSLPSESPGPHLPHLSFIRRLWNVVSRYRPPGDEFVSRERSNRGFFARRTRSNSPLEAMAIMPSQLTTAWKIRPGEEDSSEEDEEDDDPSSSKRGGKQRKRSLVDIQSPPPYDLAPHVEFHSEEHRNFWRRIMQSPPPYDLAPPAELRSKDNRSFWRRLMHV